MNVCRGIESGGDGRNLQSTDGVAKTVYSLVLGDGSSWRLVGTPDSRSWVQKFASIMKLAPDEDNRDSEQPRKLIFVRHSGQDGYAKPMDLMDPRHEEGLPRWGWKGHDWRSLRFWEHRTVPDIVCEIGNEGNHELDIIRMWTSLCILYLGVLDSGGFPLHAALVEREGQGILLAGPGGSGKSTSCRRLPSPWRVWSDDQSLIVRDNQKGYLVHPTPTWSDYLYRRSAQTWKVEHHVPLTAIFFMEQAGSDELVPMGQGKAAVSINHSSAEVCRPMWWNVSKEERKLKKRIFDNSCQLARAIPAYILRVSLTGRFWEEMEKVL